MAQGNTNQQETEKNSQDLIDLIPK